MGNQVITRNERSQTDEDIAKLEKEYEGYEAPEEDAIVPAFSIEGVKPIAEIVSDQGVKEQLDSIVMGKEVKVPIVEMTDSDPIDAESKIAEGNATNAAVDEVNEELLERLNEAAETLLKCLPDEMAKDFRTACFKDHSMKDMGIYLMGLLNRLYKVGDYYNPDIEPEWDKRVVGYSSELYCNYCNKLIENPGNLNQLFCSNLCSKNYKDKYSTGVIKPVEKEHPTEEEEDQKAWDKEEF